MTEREKVLLQREAVRRWLDANSNGNWKQQSNEPIIRALFPLPPRREPRVVRGVSGKRYRIREGDGRVEYNVPSWHNNHWCPFLEDDAAIRDLLASPYIEVPDPEDGPA